VFAGFGQGIVFTTAYLVAGSGVEANRQGVASGMASTAQQLGGSIGLAVLVDLLSAGLGASQASGLVLDGTSVPGLLHALHWVFAAQAGIALLGAVAAALVIGRRLGDREKEADRQYSLRRPSTGLSRTNLAATPHRQQRGGGSPDIRSLASLERSHELEQTTSLLGSGPTNCEST
jgi:hypothetical protein